MKQASKKTNFNVDFIWWDPPELTPIYYIKGEEKSTKGQLNFSDKTSRYVVVNQLAS